MSKFKKFIFVIAALLVLVPIGYIGISHLYDSFTPEAMQAWQEGRLSLGEIFDPKGNPFAHRFSDQKDIRDATYVIALSDSRNKYDCDLRCDGTADEVQIQAAIDACSAGGSVIILEGTANINDTINIIEPEYPDREGLNLVGQGRGTILKATGAIGSIIQIGDATHQPDGVYLAHMMLDGNSKACEIGIKFYDGGRSTFNNLCITLFKHFGLDMEFNHSVNILNCRIDQCGDGGEVPGVHPYVGGIKIGGKAAVRDVVFNKLLVEGTLIENCYDGIWLIQGTGNIFRNCIIAASARHGIVLDRDGGASLPAATTIQGCYFESNNTGAGANVGSIYGGDLTFQDRILNCYFFDPDVTWAIRLGVGSYTTDLVVKDNRFYDTTPVNLNVTSPIGAVIEGNRFSTPLTLSTPRSIAPLNLSQFKYDWDDGFQSLAKGMSLYVPGMSGANVYELSEKFTFPDDNITIFGDGPGSILKTADGLDDNLLYANAKSGLVIRDLAIDGNRANNVTADPINFTDCTDWEIRNVEIYEADDRCLYINGGSRMTIQNCYFHDADEHCIRFEGNPTDLDIRSNRFADSTYGIAFVWGGAQQFRVKFVDNWLSNFTGTILTSSAKDSIFSHNIFVDGDLVALSFAAADDNLISDNIFRSCATPIDFTAANCDRNLVIGNDWYGCTNDTSDSGTGTFFTNNIDKNGVQWTVDDNPIAIEVWVTHDNPNPSLGTIPVGSYYMRAHLHVTEEFNAGGNDDAITVGYDADPDSLVTSTAIDGVTGVVVVTLGTDNGYISTARAAEVYYTYTGGDPTQGKALVKLEFQRVPTEPA